MPGDDLIERHVDLVAGVGAIAWAFGTQLLAVPALADLCSPMIAATFGIGALARWYRKLAKRRQETTPA